MSIVRVKSCPGVACVLLGPEQVWEPEIGFYEDVETGEEYEAETGEGEWVDGDGSRVRVCMVGDNHVFTVDADECTPLNNSEFCDGCGQIGCGHGSYREA